ncbi:glutamine synthetase III family protein [Aurantibacillus circumpalustris]|uniref:glutamine synthetase III family protein n=1 Tax=Aurantibacillus circumpalustris TaxID=3036359 RepID=UPI00295A6D5C|nr:glutamine synthetase III [Aurantibacillus circumpalustris]
MSTRRNLAMQEVVNRKPADISYPDKQVSQYFGDSVFGIDAMREFLSEEAFTRVMEAMEKGVTLDRKIADQVAACMKAWAQSKGVTHFTHWFQPLTGTTAEKHDGFFEPIGGGRAVERFSGSQLVQQEPDASSFPNGGVRSTFEARGYTAWDPTSPAFIWGNTLCIPTIFVSYTGEALDFKTPLLKSLSILDKAATDVCQYFDKNVTKVIGTLGWEQEYFLIDASLYNIRYDLQQTGRTLFGHASAKGQQLEDHYWGSIPERVLAYMKDFEYESHLLGIPVRTRHNEVAPAQFECAPVFEEINIAVDHNQLLMDVMEKVAIRHNFRVLLHEKPYAGVNGSGKHNNWSLATNTGKNLLSPGKTPKTNLQFLTFFISTVKAVYEHADLMRACIASANNDHRLGANEAPPAIMSVFLGEQLNKVLEEIEKSVGDKKLSPEEKTALKLSIGKIPDILLDNTDRNRTSPFAFTGNKFEFRAVGSSANCAGAMTVLNSIVAQQLIDFKTDVDALMDNKMDKDDAIFQVLKRYIIESKKIRFEGNGYGDEWKAEAKKRGLSNIPTTPGALEAFISKKTLGLFDNLGILNHREQESRYEIYLETYTKKIQIESRIIADMVNNQIVPAAIAYQKTLVDNIAGLKNVLSAADYKVAAETQIDLAKEISQRVTTIIKSAEAMREERKKANTLDSAKKQAHAYCDKVKPYFEKIRYEVDKLEFIIDDATWPLPKYREMLYLR